MKILVEGFKCLVSESEYLAGDAKDYSIVYILNNEMKLLKETRLSHGRCVRTQVKALPDSNGSEIEPLIRFLPAGKIPAHMMKEILAFFKEVMTQLQAGPEAMIHVLWSPARGYRLAVPSQTVSKASVSYKYDHIESDEIIVLDMHSHNTMGAFFSGTDNGDDKKGIYYSGVVGKLNNPVPEMKFRFNNYEEHIECTPEDIFDFQEDSVSVPKEFLDKVKTVSYGYGGYGGGVYGGYYGQKKPGFQTGWKNPSPGVGGGRSPSEPLDLEEEEMLAMLGWDGTDNQDDPTDDALEQVLSWLDDIQDPDAMEKIIDECSTRLGFPTNH